MMLHFSAGGRAETVPHAASDKDDVARLQGRRILVVEDEALIALDLEMAIEDAGADVIGPAMSLDEGLQLSETAEFDCAILDVDLHGREVFPLAHLLAERNVPFVFHTGHAERADLEKDFPDRPVCRKPTAPNRLLGTLAQLID